jgi:hypothetical protein
MILFVWWWNYTVKPRDGGVASVDEKGTSSPGTASQARAVR